MRFVTVVLAIALLTTACNGHETTAADQIIDLQSIDTRWEASHDLHHNHGIMNVAGYDRAAVRMRAFELTTTATRLTEVVLCLTWQATGAEGEVTASGQNCSNSPIRVKATTSLTLHQVGPKVSDFPDQKLEVLDSSIAVYLNGALQQTCRYHDSLAMNDPDVCGGFAETG